MVSRSRGIARTSVSVNYEPHTCRKLALPNKCIGMLSRLGLVDLDVGALYFVSRAAKLAQQRCRYAGAVVMPIHVQCPQCCNALTARLRERRAEGQSAEAQRDEATLTVTDSRPAEPKPVIFQMGLPPFGIFPYA